MRMFFFFSILLLIVGMTLVNTGGVRPELKKEPAPIQKKVAILTHQNLIRKRKKVHFHNDVEDEFLPPTVRASVRAHGSMIRQI